MLGALEPDIIFRGSEVVPVSGNAEAAGIGLDWFAADIGGSGLAQQAWMTISDCS